MCLRECEAQTSPHRQREAQLQALLQYSFTALLPAHCSKRKACAPPAKHVRARLRCGQDTYCSSEPLQPQGSSCSRKRSLVLPESVPR